jgi:choline monooxygenase
MTLPRDWLAEFDADLPLAQAKTLPAPVYWDAGVADWERGAVFAESWQPVARVDQLAQGGDFVTETIAGEPLAMVRGNDDRVRGFFNVCRHRAGKVLTDSKGCVGKLRCQYHGWTYDLEGRLKGTPEFDGVEHFCKEDHGLTPLGGVDVWGPYVFAYIAEHPRRSLQDAFAAMQISPGTMAMMKGLTWACRKEYPVACNWKVYVDNYLDGGYHVNTVHPALASVIDYQEYRIECLTDAVLQHTPLSAGSGMVGRTRTGGRAEYWWVWPNIMINLYSGVMDTNIVVPTGPERCLVVFDYFFPPGTSGEFIQDSVAVAEGVQEEDRLVCEDVQRGLHSRSYHTGRFSVKREAGGYHFHKAWAERWRQARPIPKP